MTSSGADAIVAMSNDELAAMALREAARRDALKHVLRRSRETLASSASGARRSRWHPTPRRGLQTAAAPSKDLLLAGRLDRHRPAGDD
ncbi:MAG: hypothetical protein WKG07_46335 [Hymenobacter sp.]